VLLPISASACASTGCLGSTDPEHGQELHSCPGAIDHHAKVGNFGGYKLVSTQAVPKTENAMHRMCSGWAWARQLAAKNTGVPQKKRPYRPRCFFSPALFARAMCEAGKGGLGGFLRLQRKFSPIFLPFFFAIFFIGSESIRPIVNNL
jgi:hypothetical protein